MIATETTLAPHECVCGPWWSAVSLNDALNVGNPFRERCAIHTVRIVSFCVHRMNALLANKTLLSTVSVIHWRSWQIVVLCNVNGQCGDGGYTARWHRQLSQSGDIVSLRRCVRANLHVRPRAKCFVGGVTIMDHSVCAVCNKCNIVNANRERNHMFVTNHNTGRKTTHCSSRKESAIKL